MGAAYGNRPLSGYCTHPSIFPAYGAAQSFGRPLNRSMIGIMGKGCPAGFISAGQVWVGMAHGSLRPKLHPSSPNPVEPNFRIYETSYVAIRSSTSKTLPAKKPSYSHFRSSRFYRILCGQTPLNFPDVYSSARLPALADRPRPFPGRWGCGNFSYDARGKRPGW